MSFRIDHVLILAAGLAGVALAATTPSPFPLTVVAGESAQHVAPEPVVVDVVPDDAEPPLSRLPATTDDFIAHRLPTV